MSDSSLIPERQLVFSPLLAQTIGLEEAIFLQHLSELFEHREAQPLQGYNWLRVERDWLLKTLPFWTPVDLHRISKSLTDKGVILMDSPPLHDSDTLIFAVNESHHPAGHPAPDLPGAARTAPGASLLPANWSPGEALLRLLRLSHDIPRQFALDQLEDFVCYWRERGEISPAWENKFRRHVLGRWRETEQQQAERVDQGLAAGAQQAGANWYPSPDALEIMLRSGVSQDFIDDAVAEFVLYWREKNPRETALNSKFIQHIRRQWQRYTSSLSHDTEPQRITDDWQPSEDVFDILKLSHIDAEFARQVLPEFVLYWKDSNQLHNSWNTKFLQQVKYQWGRHNGIHAHGGQRAQRTTGRSRDRSLSDDLSDRSWAQPTAAD